LLEKLSTRGKQKSEENGFMGTGIAAVIPIVLGPPRSGWNRKIDNKYFSPTFFECYDVNEDGSVYTIRHEMFLHNYQSFLTEFYDCIGEDYDANSIPQTSNFDEFRNIFDRDERNAGVPYIDLHWSMFSMLGGVCEEYWKFYSGSYKAMLEEYSTLMHFERILAVAMKNPLAGAVKFGIYG